ncbi:hypothetical protein F444_04006 [Phytophthora nicotianae P1976]|uniref:Uncharacterized protein n=1 Tax=Phytophthora nicotianae P1976 TaxID=1317066 RepID=A0A081ASA6_PHYNI|nr:hypothetical protein F444_04006 [Phytophthora nicotianae P1976]
MRKVHRHAHEINLPPGLKLHPVFNTGSLKPYESPTQLSRPQEVILHDGRVGQIVEAVINKRHRKGTICSPRLSLPTSEPATVEQTGRIKAKGKRAREVAAGGHRGQKQTDRRS